MNKRVEEEPGMEGMWEVERMRVEGKYVLPIIFWKRHKKTKIFWFTDLHWNIYHFTSQAYDIMEHMKKHDQKEELLQCHHCSPPVTLRDVWKYCVHMLSLHTPRPFTCGICREAYPTRRECKDHILKLHAPVNPYKCEICQQEFSHIDYLNEHCKKFLHLNTTKWKRVITKNRLYTYPHMKVNVSMFDKRVLDSVRMYMCDYRETKREIMRNIKDHIVFDKQDELPRIKSEKKNRYKKKVKKIADGGGIHLSNYEHKLEIVEEVNPHDDFNEMSAARVTERKIKIEEMENNAQCLRQDLYESKLETIQYDSYDYKDIVFDEEDLLPPVKKKRKKEKIEQGAECTDDLESGFNGQKLNVIEQDGKQYVSLNGILYQVVQEDEVV